MNFQKIRCEPWTILCLLKSDSTMEYFCAPETIHVVVKRSPSGIILYVACLEQLDYWSLKNVSFRLVEICGVPGTIYRVWKTTLKWNILVRLKQFIALIQWKAIAKRPITILEYFARLEKSIALKNDGQTAHSWLEYFARLEKFIALKNHSQMAHWNILCAWNNSSR